MRSILIVMIMTLASQVVVPTYAKAVVKAGSTCTKLGAKTVVGGKAYTCIKSGNKKVWSKGVTVKAPVVAQKKSQSINVGPVSDMEISTLFFSVSVTASSGLLVQVNSLTPSICDVSLFVVITLQSPGICSLNFQQSGDSTFSAADPVSISFNVLKNRQVVKPDDSSKKLFITEKTQTIYWYADSGLEVSLKSLTPTICGVALTTLTVLALGECEIQGSQAGNDKFQAAAPVTFKYEIVKAVQEISFSRIQDTRIDEIFIDLEAYSNANDKNIVPILSTTTPKTCIVDGKRVKLLQAGDCTINVTHPGNSLYAPAPVVSQTFKVLPARLGSSQNPVTPGVAFSSNSSELTFIEFKEQVDMFSICKQSAFYDGCTYDSAFNGIPDPKWDFKLVALLFEYKNTSKEVDEAYVRFDLIYSNEVIELAYQDVPRDLRGKKLLPMATSRGYIYIYVKKTLNLAQAILLFENFDKDYQDVYVRLVK